MTAVATSPPPGGESAVAPPARSRHRADIQGLRAIAVVLVVLFHADLPTFSGGFIGVDVFFVVSGFVITRMLLTEQRATDALRLGTFYLRRIRRILPALAVMLCATMALDVVLGPVGTQQQTVRTGWAAALFSANTYLVTWGKGGYFNAPARANPLLHTWSLSLEEQFYFVFPALLVLAAWAARGRGRRTLAQTLLIGGISVLSFGLCVLATRQQLGISFLDDTFSFFMAPARFWQFGVGAVLAMVAHRLPRSSALAEVAGWTGLALIFWSALTFTEGSSFPGWIAAIPTAGAALAVIGGTHHTSSASRLLSTSPMTWTGDRSYSWYLWHWPLIVFARALWPGSLPVLSLAAAVSLIPAVASYVWIEQPIRHRPAVPRPTLRLAALCIGMPLLVGALALVATKAIDRSEAVADFRHQLRLHADATNGCFGADRPLDDEFCTWAADGRPADAVDYVLVGDSNAGQLSEPFIAAANDAGRNATIRTKGVCPFVDLSLVTSGIADTSCSAYVDGLVERIEEAEPELVVISGASDRYVTDPTITLVTPDGERARTVAEKERAWTQGLTSVVKRIQAAGSKVVVVQPIPKFTAWDPQECATARVLIDAGSCSTSDPLADLQARQAPAARAQTAAVRAAGPGVALVDPFPILCHDDPCEASRDGELWWRDSRHVSVRGAAELEALLSDGMAEATGSDR